jgi:hypothetical protein
LKRERDGTCRQLGEDERAKPAGLARKGNPLPQSHESKLRYSGRTDHRGTPPSLSAKARTSGNSAHVERYETTTEMPLIRLASILSTPAAIEIASVVPDAGRVLLTGEPLGSLSLP